MKHFPVKLRGALEMDALEHAKAFNWKAGERKRWKRAYNRRVRKAWKDPRRALDGADDGGV